MFFVLRDRDGHVSSERIARLSGFSRHALYGCAAHQREFAAPSEIEVFNDGQWMNADDLP